MPWQEACQKAWPVWVCRHGLLLPGDVGGLGLELFCRGDLSVPKGVSICWNWFLLLEGRAWPESTAGAPLGGHGLQPNNNEAPDLKAMCLAALTW